MRTSDLAHLDLGDVVDGVIADIRRFEDLRQRVVERARAEGLLDDALAS